MDLLTLEGVASGLSGGVVAMMVVGGVIGVLVELKLRAAFVTIIFGWYFETRTRISSGWRDSKTLKTYR